MNIPDAPTQPDEEWWPVDYLPDDELHDLFFDYKIPWPEDESRDGLIAALRRASVCEICIEGVASRNLKERMRAEARAEAAGY